MTADSLQLTAYGQQTPATHQAIPDALEVEKPIHKNAVLRVPTVGPNARIVRRLGANRVPTIRI
jgi:hypothetical protein